MALLSPASRVIVPSAQRRELLAVLPSARRHWFNAEKSVFRQLFWAPALEKRNASLVAAHLSINIALDGVCDLICEREKFREEADIKQEHWAGWISRSLPRSGQLTEQSMAVSGRRQTDSLAVNAKL